jgi:hypothetical protein
LKEAYIQKKKKEVQMTPNKPKRGKNTTRDEKTEGNRDLRGFKTLIGTTTIERQSGNG